MSIGYGGTLTHQIELAAIESVMSYFWCPALAWKEMNDAYTEYNIYILICMYGGCLLLVIHASKRDEPTWVNIGLTIPGNCWSFVADFMKSGGFHVKSGDIAFPLHSVKLKSFSWNLWFIRFPGGFHLKSAQNLPDFTWNPPDFMKSRLECELLGDHQVQGLSYERPTSSFYLISHLLVYCPVNH